MQQNDISLRQWYYLCRLCYDSVDNMPSVLGLSRGVNVIDASIEPTNAIYVTLND